MSTRCRIAIKNQDGSYDSIYCHNDGYPEGVGLTLANYYKDEKKVRDLLALGDISSLGQTLDYIPTFGDLDFDMFDMSKYPDYRGTVHYNRWLEGATHAEHSKNIKALRRLAVHSAAEYLYIYDDGEWKEERILNQLGKKLILKYSSI